MKKTILLTTIHATVPNDLMIDVSIILTANRNISDESTLINTSMQKEGYMVSYEVYETPETIQKMIKKLNKKEQRKEEQ